MTQKEFAGEIAYDWELWIGRTALVAEVLTTTWTQIYGFETLPFPDQTPSDEDATHMNSPGRTKETVPGLMSVASWSQEKQLWPGDPGDTLLDDLVELTKAGTKEDVIFEFNIKPDGTSIRRAYRGYVDVFTPTGTVGGKAMSAVGAKLMNSVTPARVIE